MISDSEIVSIIQPLSKRTYQKRFYTPRCRYNFLLLCKTNLGLSLNVNEDKTGHI